MKRISAIPIYFVFCDFEISIFIADYNYVVQANKWCQPYKSEYSTLLEARKNCNLDPDCKMFYELVDSPNQGFVLCDSPVEIKPSSYNSRLYRKNGNYEFNMYMR